MEKFFKALSNNWRIRIIEILRYGEMCQCEIVRKIPLDETTLSRHIQILKDAGIVVEKREGRKKVLRLSSEDILKILEIAEKFKGDRR